MRIGLQGIPAVFVPYGEPKTAYVQTKDAILVDDYSKNLHEWEKSGREGIKFFNGFNRGRSRNGALLDRRMKPEEILKIIQDGKKAG